MTYDFALFGLLSVLVLLSYVIRRKGSGKPSVVPVSGTKTLWTGNEITPAAQREINAWTERYFKVLEGQDALREQTVRIRKAALGEDPDPGSVDTEKLVADLRANYDRLLELTQE